MNEFFTAQIGKKVEHCKTGHGSFLTIEFYDQNGRKENIRFWVYMCEWAITVNGVEKINSDSQELKKLESLGLLENKTIQEIVFLDNEEFHILFDNETALEIWKLDDTEDRAEALLVFKNEECLGTIYLPPPLPSPSGLINES
ncbi:MAG: hypothetical protein ABJN65_11990 [Parasphingorhabdus sp.]